MKILYLANIRIPSDKGESLQIMKMCEAMSALGHIVELVVPRRRSSKAYRVDPFEFYNIKTKFKITKFFTIDLMPWQKMFGHLAFKLNYWLFARLASFSARLTKADIIYSRDWRTLQLLKTHKQNLIFELHEFRVKDIWAYQSIAPACQKIIVITEGLKKKLLEIEIPADKILVAADAVAINEFDISLTQSKARAGLNLPAAKKLVVYTGHLYKWKGIDTLVEAFKILDKKKSDIMLILVGGQETQVQELKSKIKAENISNIIILGHKSYTQMPVFLKAADALVISDSSRQDISREYTSPLKLFQYMAAKKPIVAPATPAIKEILDETNSYLFEPDNPASLAEAIIKSLGSDPDSKHKVEHAWALVQEFTWEKRAEKILTSHKL